MRGFTMILVVAYHVSMMGYGENPKDSSYLSLCVLFRMPLFFFISGFFAYSSRTQWSLPVLVRSLWKKFRIQVIPTVVFFALFIIMLHRGSWDKAVSLLQHDTKGGYWFTIVLLQMFVIYYLFAYVEHFFAPRLERLRLRWLPITLLWLCALCVYATWYMPSWFHEHRLARTRHLRRLRNGAVGKVSEAGLAAMVQFQSDHHLQPFLPCRQYRTPVLGPFPASFRCPVVRAAHHHRSSCRTL